MPVMYLTTANNNFFNNGVPECAGDLVIASPEIAGITTASYDFTIGTLNTSSVPLSFPTFQQGIDYIGAQMAPAILAAVNAQFTPGYYTYGGVVRDQASNFLTVNAKQDASTSLQQIKTQVASFSADVMNMLQATDATAIAAAAGSSRTTSSFTPTLVGTGATGSQLSATKSGKVAATFKTSTTSTLAGNNSSLVTAKICATNSATEANWSVAGSTGSDQPSGISVTVGQVISSTGQIVFDVPAGWYFKFVNTGTGTHAETVVSGSKTIFG